MTKLDRAIEALSALPDDRREEVAEMVLELTAQLEEAASSSVLGGSQREEVRRRRAGGFRAGDAGRIDQLLARLA